MEMEQLWKELERVVGEQAALMKPVPYEAVDVEYEEWLFPDGEDQTNAKWKELMAEHLTQASSFEIHCWAEEAEAITLALQYGTKKVHDWRYGEIIEGPVTPAFVKMVLELPQPKDDEIGCKMTPFFSIFLDHGFSSEHYGRENRYVPVSEV